jgi:hypothetical protein
VVSTKHRLPKIAAGMASLIMIPLGVTVVTAGPASATVHCKSNGTPGATSGRFVNNTGGTMMVKGDAKVNGVFKTVERAIGKEGGTAWGAGICDADFFKAYTDFIWAGTEVKDGDVYQKIGGGSTIVCQNFAVRPGTPINTECG